MDKISLKEKFLLVDQYWTPKILGEVNDSYIKIFKAKGEFVWHQHDHEDELFVVVQGTLYLKFRDKEVVLNAGEVCIVPKGVEHCPYALEEAHVMLVEPKGVVNTGDVDSEKTVKAPDWI